MGVAILAPFPAVHMGAAIATHDAVGRVAFGSNAWETLQKAVDEYGVGIPVLIYPTHRYGDPDHLVDPGYANFRAIFDGLKIPRRGVHPDPNVRPIITVQGDDPDTKWPVYWEITDLAKLSNEDRIAITSLTAVGQCKPLPKGFVPHGPILVKAAFP